MNEAAGQLQSDCAENGLTETISQTGLIWGSKQQRLKKNEELLIWIGLSIHQNAHLIGLSM